MKVMEAPVFAGVFIFFAAPRVSGAPGAADPMIARRTLLFALVALVAVTTALEANPSAATAETKTAEAAATPPAYPFMYPWMGMYPYMGLYHMWMMPWMWGFPYYGFPYFY